MVEPRIAIFCDEYDRQSKIFRRNHTSDLARSASRATGSTSMGVNRRAIEGEVDEAMSHFRRPERLRADADILIYFNAWLARRGGWE